MGNVIGIVCFILLIFFVLVQPIGNLILWMFPKPTKIQGFIVDLKVETKTHFSEEGDVFEFSQEPIVIQEFALVLRVNNEDKKIELINSELYEELKECPHGQLVSVLCRKIEKDRLVAKDYYFAH